ncbi:peptide ABC transporter permease [Corynebacterium atypicum]|uniref:Peptide ABC transporter permease n=1 Tax=Corynebacterium atypicum TaxID=191610 RepID=A0ABM5QP41_9CORY|nr:ABC transporter permease [Corynebacterium atypicum]AIG64576.1 peptide ABC transporter permease [Corynebacterium atypicum]
MNTRTFAGRLAQGLVVLLITFTAAFFLLSALPSDGILARYAGPDLGLSLAEIEQIRADFGADDPLIVQYFSTLTGFLTGEFGYSVQTGSAVSTMLAEALPGTIVLALAAFAVAVVLALGIAAVAALERPRWLAAAVRQLPALMVSWPSFWVGIILIQVVSFQLGWVPVIEPSEAQALILPAITLAIPVAAPLAQVLVRSVEDVKTQPFVAATRARGASPTWLFWRTVLRSALLPAVTMAGLIFGELVGGAVVTEAVFGRRGLGALTVDAVAYRDTPVLLAVVVISAAAFVLINLIVDLIYPLLDPRLREKR